MPDDGGSTPDLAASFDRGAGHYDLLVSLNPGYHRHLRSAAAALAVRLGSTTSPRLLDLACGSGASTAALLGAAPLGATITGVDLSPGMLEQARRKPWPGRVDFVLDRVGSLGPDVAAVGPYDGALACYLFRNVPEQERDAALQETFALLRPGAWLVVQEYSVAGNRRASAVWEAVCRLVITPLALLVDRDASLYRYLRRSVRRFDSVPGFAARLAAAGFTDVMVRTAPGWQRGILHTFAARRPSA